MVNNNLVCHACNKEFSSVSTKNRHIKKVHHETVEKKRSVHIKCPLCPEEHKLPFANHEDLIKHLNDLHGLVKKSVFHFRNIEEFEVWRKMDSKDFDYVLHRKVKGNDGESRNYDCNRSNSQGFFSTCKQSKMKSGGSIKISGICPSRILVKILDHGLVTVKFTETHVGHADDQRSKRLTEDQQHLMPKVTNKKIIQNARIIKNNKAKQTEITRGDSVSSPLNATTTISEEDEDVLKVVDSSTSQNNNQQNLKLFLEETHPSKKDDINF